MQSQPMDDACALVESSDTREDGVFETLNPLCTTTEYKGILITHKFVYGIWCLHRATETSIGNETDSCDFRLLREEDRLMLNNQNLDATIDEHQNKTLTSPSICPS
jgi:hypothetical protein